MQLKKALIIIVTGIIFLPSFFILAQVENKAEGVTISPPISEIQIEPGNTVVRKIKITNPISKQIKLYPSALDFKAKGETGEPLFLPPSLERRSYSLASWISFSKSFLILEPEEVEEFEYTIKVPDKAEPGGHYGVVFFATEPPKLEEDVNKVAISTMVGSLILAKVPGQITEKALLEEFSTDKKLYLKNNKVKIISRVANVGNVHFKPVGEITIKNIFGKTEGKLSFNEQTSNVLPDSIRKFENNWESKKILVGPYTATAKYIYGESEKTLEGKVTFWIIPWWLILIVALLVLIAIYLIWRRKKKKKDKRGKDQKVIDLRR